MPNAKLIAEERTVGIRLSGTLNRFLLSQLFSAHGIWMLRVCFGWVAWETTHSAFWVGAVSSVTMLPSLFLTPVFGVLADRIRLRVAMSLVMSVMAVLSAILSILAFSGSLGLLALIAMATVFGVATAFHHSFRLTVPARIDVETPLHNIIGMSAIVFNISGIVGPAIAGFALAVASEAVVFGLASLFYIAYLLLFRTLEFKPRADPPPFPGFFSEFSSGMRVALKMPEFLVAAASVFATGLIGRALIAQLPSITGKLLDGNADVYASLVATAAAGAIVAGFVLARVQGTTGSIRRNLYRAAVLAMIICGACSAFENFMSFWVAVASLGFLLTVVGANSQSLLQLAVADKFRGRVMSFWSMAVNGGSAIGVLALGAAGDAFGMRPALLAAGVVGGTLIFLVLFLDLFRARRSVPTPTNE